MERFVEEDKMRCNILIPRWDALFEDENGECILANAHSGYHLNKLNNSMYLSWGGNACDELCEFCGECFNWLELSEAEAQAVILQVVL